MNSKVKCRILVRYVTAYIAIFTLCYALDTIYMQTMVTNNHELELNYSTLKETTRDDLEKKQHRLPNAVIVGMARCGTRALLNFFKIHPDVSHQLLLNTREINFFNENYEKGLEWYKKKMVRSTEGQIVMEKSPRYFCYEGVPERMYKMNSSIKVIVVLCNPVRRAISSYTSFYEQSQRDGTYLKPFEEIFIDQDGNVRENRTSKGCYVVNLKRWLNVFPLHQIHFVNGEALSRDPFLELKKLERFLGISDFFERGHFVYVDWKGFYCLKPPSMPKRVVCLGQSKGRTHVQVDPLVVQKLDTFFKKCNKPLVDLIHQNYSWAYSP